MHRAHSMPKGPGACIACSHCRSTSLPFTSPTHVPPPCLPPPLSPPPHRALLAATAARTQVMVLSLRAAPADAPITTQAPSVMDPQDDDDISLEVDLWRADLLTGILELGPTGRVVHKEQPPLYAPSLILGLPHEALLGQPASRLLPLGDHTVAELFTTVMRDPSIGGNSVGVASIRNHRASTDQLAIGAEMRKKSSLKVERPMAEPTSRVGPVQVRGVGSVGAWVGRRRGGEGGNGSGYGPCRPYK